MKKILLLFLFPLVIIPSTSFAVWVNSYFKGDGTHVSGHYRNQTPARTTYSGGSYSVYPKCDDYRHNTNREEVIARYEEKINSFNRKREDKLKAQRRKNEEDLAGTKSGLYRSGGFRYQVASAKDVVDKVVSEGLKKMEEISVKYNLKKEPYLKCISYHKKKILTERQVKEKEILDNKKRMEESKKWNSFYLNQKYYSSPMITVSDSANNKFKIKYGAGCDSIGLYVNKYISIKTSGLSIKKDMSVSVGKNNLCKILSVENMDTKNLYNFITENNSLKKIDGKKCSLDLIMSQNLRAPKTAQRYIRNGKYDSYAKETVKEAHILQKHLNRLGFSAGKVDGIIGPNTRGAILRLQKYLGTKQDGYVGPKTRDLLNNSCK